MQSSLQHTAFSLRPDSNQRQIPRPAQSGNPARVVHHDNVPIRRLKPCGYSRETPSGYDGHCDGHCNAIAMEPGHPPPHRARGLTRSPSRRIWNRRRESGMRRKRPRRRRSRRGAGVGTTGSGRGDGGEQGACRSPKNGTCCWRASRSIRRERGSRGSQGGEERVARHPGGAARAVSLMPD